MAVTPGGSRGSAVSAEAALDGNQTSDQLGCPEMPVGPDDLLQPLFGLHDVLIARTRELIDECTCDSECPSCVGPEGATGPLAKPVASRLLQSLMAARAAA